MRRLIALCASALLCLLLLPVSADWSRVQVGTAQVCKDSVTGATFKPPYAAKADVTKACNTLTSFVPWLGTAEAATVLTRTVCNPDHTCDTSYPSDAKNNATVSWNDSTLATAMALVVAQNTGTATDINLLTYCTGTGCAAATYTLQTAVTGWSIGGSGSTHLLNSGASPGSSVASGALTLKVTNGSSTDTSAAFPWSYVVPPVPAVRFHPGWYFDCSIEVQHADHRLAIGNSAYTQTKTCIDYAATQTGITGVFVLADWTSFEGSTLGCYDSSCSNGLGAAGTIGDPFVADLLAYAASKSMKLILGIEWGVGNAQFCGNGFSGASPDTYFPAYMLQSSCSPGTDGSSTYGITLDYTNGYLFAQLWEAASMNRLIALAQHLGTLADANTTMEKLVLIEQDPAFLSAEGTDGFTWAALATQLARIPTAIRPYWQHTNLGIETNWLTPSGGQTLIAAMSNASAYVGVEANNSIVWQTTYGENTYMGLGTVSGQSFGTTDYRTLIPFGTWTAGPELCTQWDSYAAHNGLPATSNTTPQQFYDTYFTNGKSDETSPRTLNPSWWIVNRAAGAAPAPPSGTGCPTVASQNWGLPAGTGWANTVANRTLNTTCPTLYAGGCNRL